MQLCKVQVGPGVSRVGVVENGQVRLLLGDHPPNLLTHILHSEHPRQRVQELLSNSKATLALEDLYLLPPLDQQEVWAAGVTYKRSEEARREESEGGASLYERVYMAARPELFFKATANRVVGPLDKVRIRKDSTWNVPEPELALVLTPQLKLVGYTLANDMSSRDIEGENPLYLPQAKLYEASCALGPVITFAEDIADPRQIVLRMVIEREGKPIVEGSTEIGAMKRTFADLIHWLGRDNVFPSGVILLTGTGIVPPNDFTLRVGDVVHIEGTGLGRLTNIVERRV